MLSTSNAINENANKLQCQTIEQTIKQIEEERKLKNKELLSKEKKLIKKLAEKYKDDPEAYAREIADKFGFEFVE